MSEQPPSSGHSNGQSLQFKSMRQDWALLSMLAFFLLGALGVFAFDPHRWTRWIAAAMSISSLLLLAPLQRIRRRELGHAREFVDALLSLQSISTAVSAKLSHGSEVLEELCNETKRMLHTSGALITLLEEDGRTLRVMAGSTRLGHKPSYDLADLPAARRCVTERVVVVIENAESQHQSTNVQLTREHQILAFMDIPLQIHGRIIGVFMLSCNQPRHFTDLDRQLAEVWGANAGVLLANIRLYEQAEESRKEQHRLLEQSEKLSSASIGILEGATLRQTLDRIVELAPPVLVCDVIGVALWEEDGRYLRLLASTRTEDVTENMRACGSDPLARQLYAARDPVEVSNIQKEKSNDETWEKVPEARTVLFIPMMRSDGTPLGVLSCIRFATARFTTEQHQLARVLGSRAGSALENTQLLEQSREDAQSKTMLLRELNHRVKNNLAGIVSLLEAEQFCMPVAAKHRLQRLTERIRTMAHAHDLFAGGVSSINLAALVNRVVDSLAVAKPPGVQIRINLHQVAAHLQTGKAVSLASVLHELCSNALEHGLGNHGTLDVIGSREHNDLRIEVRDSGTATSLPGFDSSAEAGSSIKMGLQLVSGMVRRELHGQFLTSGSETGGRCATVVIPLTEDEWGPGAMTWQTPKSPPA